MGRPGRPETLKPYQPGDPRRVGVKHNAVTREKMRRAALKREAAKRVAREHVKQEAVQQRLKINAETAAFDKVYRDALEYLLAHQLEPAEALREIVGDRKHPDRMRAVGEWLDRTHGKPVQVQRTVALTGQLSPGGDRPAARAGRAAPGAGDPRSPLRAITRPQPQRVKGRICRVRTEVMRNSPIRQGPADAEPA